MLFRSAGRAGDATRICAAIETSVTALEHEIDNLKSLITELRPASLDALGLVPALRTLAARAGSAHGVDLRTSIDLGSESGTRLAPDLETAIYRVAQEALTNVGKHAHAGQVEVALDCDEDRVTLVVADDGVGFEPLTAGSGFGLLGMAERVALAGGTLAIDSGAGGTRVQATFALVRDQPDNNPWSSA